MNPNDPTINMTLNQLKSLYKNTKREDIKKIIKNKINKKVNESKLINEMNKEIEKIEIKKRKEKAIRDAYDELVNNKNDSEDENNSENDTEYYEDENIEDYVNIDINRISTVFTKNIVNDKRFKEPIINDHANNRLLGRLETEIKFRTEEEDKEYIGNKNNKNINLGKRKNLRN